MSAMLKLESVFVYVWALPLFWKATILLLPILIYTVLLVTYRLYLHPLAKYPGPLLGRLTNWNSVYHAYIGDKHLALYYAHEKYGSFVRYAPNVLSINEPEAIKEIYGINRNVRKSIFYQPAIEHSGVESTFNARDRQLHAWKRRIMAPAFTNAALATMEEYILPHMRNFFKYASDEERFPSASQCWTADMSKWGNYLTFDVMGDLVFGKGFDMLAGNESRELPGIVDGAAHRELIAGSSPFINKWGLDKVLFRDIVQRGSRLIKYAKQQSEKRMEADPDRKDFLWYLTNSKEKDGSPSYTDVKDIFSEARTLMIGGSDTTATQIAANFFYLTQNPQTLSKLTSEIRSAFSSIEEIRLGPQLSSCEYLNAVIDETIRISPSLAGVLPREVLSGGITVCDEYFPKGVELTGPIYALHHNATVFPAPHKHIPERWLPSEVGEQAVQRAHNALTPFSYGSRMCIGFRLALMELRMLLARSVFTYDLEYVEGGREDRLRDEANEFKLLDHLAAARTGPIVRFIKRRDL